MVSSSWFIRGMPSVVTLSTCVSPRWKSAEPWAVGRRSTSADSGRMSAVPRPSMRTPSSTMRLRTSFLVRPRMARLDLARPLGELLGQGRLDLFAGRVEGGVALRLRRHQVGLGDRRRCPPPATRCQHVVLVVGEGGVRDGLDRPPGGGEGVDQLALEDDRLADPLLGRLEAGRQHLLGHLRGARLVVGPRLLGPARLDHHDGDLAVGVVAEGTAGHHELEGATPRPPRRWGAGSSWPSVV